MARNVNYMGFSSDENSSDDEQNRAAVCFVLIGAALRKQELSRRRKRRKWVAELCSSRHEKGLYENLVQELKLHDNEDFRRFVRMNTDACHVAIISLRYHWTARHNQYISFRF